MNANSPIRKLTTLVFIAGMPFLYLASGCTASKKAANQFETFPTGTSPLEVGKKIAWHYVETPHTNVNRPAPPRVITYPETCTWYGALTFANESGDKLLLSQVAQRFEPLFGS